MLAQGCSRPLLRASSSAASRASRSSRPAACSEPEQLASGVRDTPTVRSAGRGELRSSRLATGRGLSGARGSAGVTSASASVVNWSKASCQAAAQASSDASSPHAPGSTTLPRRRVAAARQCGGQDRLLSGMLISLRGLQTAVDLLVRLPVDTNEWYRKNEQQDLALTTSD